MKKILYSLILILLICSSGIVYAANDLTVEEGFEFTVNGMTFTATGNIDELIVNDTTFIVDISLFKSLTTAIFLIKYINYPISFYAKL